MQLTGGIKYLNAEFGLMWDNVYLFSSCYTVSPSGCEKKPKATPSVAGSKNLHFWKN